MTLIKRFFIPLHTRSFFLFGPRGTGKSTLIQNQLDENEVIWIDLLRPEIARRLLAQPERLRELIDAYPERKLVVIDEVQKVPSLLAVVHSLIEEKRGLQFILTGLSSRKLKRTGADLLAGRALRSVLHPFMAAELGELFSLSDALEYGLLPLLFGEQDKKNILHAYIHLYLQEEIQAEGLVRNLEDFSRFLEAITFSHGSLLNITKSFWRTRSGTEVDFIVYGAKQFWAIEVKNSSKIYNQDTKSLEAFLKDYPEAKTILLYRGTDRLKINNVLCVPCDEFLKQLRPNQPIYSW